MRIVSKDGAGAISHDGVTYEPDESGAFDVPEEVGAGLLRFPAWVEAGVAAAEAEAEKAVSDLDPKALAERLEQAEARIAELLQEKADREAADAAAAAVDPAAPGQADVKPKRGKK